MNTGQASMVTIMSALEDLEFAIGGLERQLNGADWEEGKSAKAPVPREARSLEDQLGVLRTHLVQMTEQLNGSRQRIRDTFAVIG